MTEEISFEEFQKMELKTGTILSCETIDGKDKLYKLSIDLGEESPRTLVSGLRTFYSVEELVGRQIIVIANLAPRKIAGIESKGMLLAVEADSEQLSLLTPDKKVTNGLRVE